MISYLKASGRSPRRRAAIAAAAATVLWALLWLGFARGHAVEAGSAARDAQIGVGTIASSRPYTAAGHALHLPLVLSPPPQPPPQLPNNGDFEAGRVGWSEYSAFGQVLIRSQADLSVAAHGGNWAAGLGRLDDELSMLSQGVQIPADRACLVYWQWTVSSDTCNADYGGIGVNGNWVDVFSLCSGTATAGWVRRQISMTAYIANAVVINVAVVNDYSFPSALYVDDISLQPTAQCAGAGSASGPGATDDLVRELLTGRPITDSLVPGR